MNSYQDKDFRVRDRVLLYARGLDLPPAESVEIALESLTRCSSEHPSYAEALENLHLILAERGRELIPSDDKPHLVCAPPMKRSTMLPEELDRTPWLNIFKKTISRLFRALPAAKLRATWKDNAERQQKQEDWTKVASRRRTLLMTLILVPAIIGAFLMYSIFPEQGIEAVKITTSVLFAILFGWISIGFWMCAAGCWQLMRKVDRFAPTAGCDAVEIADDCRTAIQIGRAHV